VKWSRSRSCAERNDELDQLPAWDDELDQLPAWDDDRIRAEICQFAVGPLPAALGLPGLRDAGADILRWVWTTTLVPDWPRRRGRP
jgi:hypothetical protein